LVDAPPAPLEDAIRDRAAARAAVLTAIGDGPPAREPIAGAEAERLRRTLHETLDLLRDAARIATAPRGAHADEIDAEPLRDAVTEAVRSFTVAHVAPDDAARLLDGRAPRDRHGRAIRGLERARWTRDVTLGGRHLWSLHDGRHRLVARIVYDTRRRAWSGDVATKR